MLKVIPLTLFHLLAHAFTVFGLPFVWNHSTCWAAAVQTEDLNVAESPASALCSIRKLIVFDTISPREYFIFTLFLNGIISKSLIKGASTANTLMRETCHATVNGEIVTDWHVIESRLLAAIDECGYHNVQDQVDPLLHRWLWLTPQVDSRPN